MKFMRCDPVSTFKVLAPSTNKGVLKWSLGYISYPEPLFNNNGGGNFPYIGNTFGYITRRGKRGKPRIERVSMRVPFLFDEKLAEEKLEKGNEMTFADAMYGQFSVLYSVKKPNNISEMGIEDFMGWANALDDYFSTVLNNNGAYELLNAMHIGKHNPIKKFHTFMERFFDGDEGPAKALFMDIAFRHELVLALREKEKAITPLIAQHKKMLDNAVAGAIDHKLSYLKMKKWKNERLQKTLESLKKRIEKEGPEKVIKLLS